ncbi:hypothetical protein GDO81_008659 [Engystomops pustulosus]|uniref:Uncharacterized protein n=1 Tax=Engystomops pustulosus TaxID=76066 RepID=A0AAV7CGC9_ENGPU|nr:hypothetical protein GDO81_008659 [Engystomops pustulosus]
MQNSMSCKDTKHLDFSRTDRAHDVQHSVEGTAMAGGHFGFVFPSPPSLFFSFFFFCQPQKIKKKKNCVANSTTAEKERKKKNSRYFYITRCGKNPEPITLT